MSRHAFSAIVLGGLLLSSSAWAIPQATSCRARSHAQDQATLGPAMCLLLQDPWQDCNEDPWQLSTLVRTRDTFSDPWQDAGDPWQPFPALPHLPPASAVAADLAEDPWQPATEDPWQDDDPWQVR